MKNLNTKTTSITIKSLLFSLLFICSFNFSAKSQTTVFSDDFNRSSVITSAPTTYKSSQNGASTSTSIADMLLLSGADYSLRLIPFASAPPQTTVGVNYVAGDYVAPLALNSGSGYVIWNFHMKMSRTTFPLSSFSATASANWEGCVILAATNSNLSSYDSSPATGYAVTLELGNSISVANVSTTNSSADIILPVANSGIFVGQAVTGTGIGSATTYVSFISSDGLTITLSKPSTATGSVTVAFKSNTLKLRKFSVGLGTTGGSTLITPTIDPFQGLTAPTAAAGASPAIFSKNKPYKTDWVSVKVIYSQSDSKWEYFYRGDGFTPNPDFSTSSDFTSLGSVVDVTYKNSSITNFGFLFSHATTSDQPGSSLLFDNFTVQTATTLPIKLLNFDAVAKQKSVSLSWATASEKDNALFKVEQSTNGLDFKTVGEITGAGTKETVSNYTFEDKNPALGTSYYRLKQVDFNGTATFSDIKAVKFTNKEFALAYNLVQNNLQVSLNSAAETSLAVYNMAGQQMIKTKAIGQANLDVSALKPGVYVISAGNGASANFIKQ